MAAPRAGGPRAPRSSKTALPHGTRFLVITCFSPDDGQFRGIREVSGLLGRRRDTAGCVWDGTAFALTRRRSLRWVLVSGHGSEETARIGGGAAPSGLTPEHLSLPPSARLYLLGCYQGLPPIRAQWARGSGLPEDAVFGCRGETESALSTLLLLNLYESGPEEIDTWFPRWLEANDALCGLFPEMRRLYRECGRSWRATLDRVSREVDLEPLRDFLEAGNRHSSFLTGLGHTLGRGWGGGAHRGRRLREMGPSRTAAAARAPLRGGYRA